MTIKKLTQDDLMPYLKYYVNSAYVDILEETVIETPKGNRTFSPTKNVLLTPLIYDMIFKHNMKVTLRVGHLMTNYRHSELVCIFNLATNDYSVKDVSCISDEIAIKLKGIYGETAPDKSQKVLIFHDGRTFVTENDELKPALNQNKIFQFLTNNGYWIFGNEFFTSGLIIKSSPPFEGFGVDCSKACCVDNCKTNGCFKDAYYNAQTATPSPEPIAPNEY
jgi:hypothetical protein